MCLLSFFQKKNQRMEGEVIYFCIQCLYRCSVFAEIVVYKIIRQGESELKLKEKQAKKDKVHLLKEKLKHVLQTKKNS